MADIQLAFSYTHPFWAEALELRKTNSIAEITRVAGSKGYDLSYRQISLGLSRAPLNTLAPVIGSLWLRRKYVDLEKEFNSFQTMRDLAQEAMRKASDASEELESDEELTMLRRTQLEMTRDKWLGTAFSWSERIAKLEVQVSALVSKPPPAPEAPPKEEPRRDITDEVNAALADFKSKLPSVTSTDLSQQFGGDNIRLPSGKENAI